MKQSEISKEQMQSLSYVQKWKISCDGVKDAGECAEVALLLGGGPPRAVERARAAATLYKEGRVKTIIPSGGVKWAYHGERISEAEIMKRTLLEKGVPEEAIVDHVTIVTSVWHMKRSLALAKTFLPRTIKISGHPSYPNVDIDMWIEAEENHKF